MLRLGVTAARSWDSVYLRVAFGIAALAVLGCAPSMRPYRALPSTAIQAELRAQDTLRTTLFLERRLRLFNTAGRLRVFGAPLCPGHLGSWVGILAVSDPVEGQALVLHVATSSPAADAGVRRGDLVLAINEHLPRMVEHLEVYPSQAEGLSLRVRTDGSPARVVKLGRVPACDPVVQLYHSPLIDAKAKADNSVWISSGMMAFAASDDALALVVGHELGHVIRGHIHHRWFEEWELEADYLGAYLAACAGYGVGEAEHLWRRFAAEVAGTATARPHTREHMARRAVAAQATVAEIHRKSSEGRGCALS